MAKKTTSVDTPQNTTEVVDETIDDSTDTHELGAVESGFKELYESLAEHKQQASDLTTKVKALEKLAKKLEKDSLKKNKPKNKTPREPSGITKPTLLSKELCSYK